MDTAIPSRRGPNLLPLVALLLAGGIGLWIISCESERQQSAVDTPNETTTSPSAFDTPRAVDASQEYWDRLAALRRHAHELRDQIATLEESNKRFNGPEYNPCLADAEGGVGRCVSEQATALESLHRLLIDEVVTEREALASTDRYRVWLIEYRKFLLAHGSDSLPTNDMLQKVEKERSAMQQAMLRWESTLDATDNTYIQAMLSGLVVNSNTELQAAPETVRDPERKHRCVEAIAAARTYRLPTVPLVGEV